MVTPHVCRMVRRKRVNSLTTSHRAVTARSRSSVAASSSLRRTMSDCPKDDFCLLMLWLELMEVQHGAPPRSGLATDIRSCLKVRCGACAKRSRTSPRCQLRLHLKAMDSPAKYSLLSSLFTNLG